MKIELRYDDKPAREALAKAPDVVRRMLGGAIEHGARELAQEARANVAKRNGFGHLLNSINVNMLGPLHGEVRAAELYARMVEEGTGPAAGKPKYYPNPDRLKDWLTLNPRYRGHAWAKPGSTKRGNQALDIWLRSRAWAWGIYQKGTKAYPFMAPAFDAKKGRVVELANEAMRRAVADINGGAHGAA